MQTGNNFFKIISRCLWIIWGAFIFLACDTTDNVEPRFDKFFIKYYGSDGDQYGADLKRTQDGGYILIGTTDPDQSLAEGSENASGDEDIVVVKTDSLGNQEWIRFYNSGPGIYDEGRSVVEIQGGYLIAGNAFKSAFDVDIVVYQLSLDGVVLNGPLFFDEGARETCNNITVLSDGYIIAGSTTAAIPNPPDEPDEQDFYTVRLDFSLVEDPDWATNKIAGRQGKDIGIKVFQRNAGSDTLVIFGYTDRPDGPQYADNTLNSWQFIGTVNGADAYYGDLEQQICSDIAESVGGFLMIGTLEGDPSRMYYVRTNELEPAVNRAVFTQFDLEGRSIVRSRDGDNIVLGQIKHSSVNRDIFLGKTDFNGVEKWSRTFGDNGQDDGARVIENPDGSIVFVGTMNLSGQRKITLIKTNSNGELKL